MNYISERILNNVWDEWIEQYHNEHLPAIKYDKDFYPSTIQAVPEHWVISKRFHAWLDTQGLQMKIHSKNTCLIFIVDPIKATAFLLKYS